ncbi:MAG: glycoside hydrolase family 3 C-terminal domain-containing protein [Bacteroidales bacterium]|nr:glycoside hydrolase family 3 C-terminal domain-containing protein [Bacteroidales bacterium]
MKRFLFLIPAALLLITGCTGEPSGTKTPSNPKGPSPEERASALIAHLTLEEKAALMQYSSAAVDSLGIPAYNWWNEALHGVARNGKATTFPQPIGMAASFDEPLLEEVFTAVSDEARVKHRQALASGESAQYQGVTFWTPNINIFRDPRWGRGMETYGEDPYLTGQLGMAVVRGLQGPSDAAVLKAHACAKHFAVHSGPEWNRHSYDAEVSERDLRETYLPAFKDLVTKADVQEVMVAYNRFREVPCAASTFLLDTVLRGEWGFKGMVTSDCWAIRDFYAEGCHGYSKDVVEAVAAAVKAGTDLNCGNSYPAIPEAVRKGLLDEADVDRCLLRLLSARIRLGEMDRDNTPWLSLGDEIVEGAGHLALARKMADESIVLLQNRGGILPLKAGSRIALIGPNADDKEMLWGNYTPIPEQTVTLADALRERIPDLVCFRACGLIGSEFMPAPNPANPFSRAMEMDDKQLEMLAKKYAVSVNDIKNYISQYQERQKNYLPALDPTDVLKQLEGIDIVIFAGGISPRLEGEEMPVDAPGFRGGDRTDIQLPAVQRQLLECLNDAGKKVVFVNFSGSAMGLEPETATCDAIVQAWYPGQEGGTALAGILFGEVNPSGKLPVTFYKGIEQIPDFEDYAMKGRTYRYFEGEPLYPFGYGLSYTSFEYGKARVRKGHIVIPVTNTGSRDGDEVVQLYVRLKTDTEGPLKSLRGFKRVSIPAGKTVKVSIPLTEETFLSWSDEAGDMVPVKGRWELLYGGSSADAALKKADYKW